MSLHRQGRPEAHSHGRPTKQSPPQRVGPGYIDGNNGNTGAAGNEAHAAARGPEAGPPNACSLRENKENATLLESAKACLQLPWCRSSPAHGESPDAIEDALRQARAKELLLGQIVDGFVDTTPDKGRIEIALVVGREDAALFKRRPPFDPKAREEPEEQSRQVPSDAVRKGRSLLQPKGSGSIQCRVAFFSR
jgi:hypothetical protein